ncbi:hypothetical protein K4F52_002805 [Lecanicillium sp. MT-2017a]|nr:hypothetical protein K4F52_002805 [Lecanicillium sp. MT-2017a]
MAPTSTSNTTSNRYAPTVVQTVYIHEAVVVQWKKGDRDDFPFSVPNMASPTFVHTWIPGSELQDYDGGAGSSHGVGFGGGMIAIIVVCTIVGLIVFLGLLCCAKRALEPSKDARNRAPPGSSTELDQRRKVQA